MWGSFPDELLAEFYAAYSDRFAYLSWFMLPWIITYPFTPRKFVRNSAGIMPVRKLRLGLLAAALLAHFAFTFFMYQVYYKGVI
jgi:hypothetical protein